MAAGCEYEEKVLKSTWGDFEQEVGTRSQSGRRARPTAARTFDQPTWAIELSSFKGDKQATEAERFAQQLYKRTRVPDLWVASNDDATYVYRGQYLDDKGLSARSDLRQTRMLQVEGARPFESAALVRVDERHGEPDRGTGVTRKMNLKKYSGQELYTLQIAVYDELYGNNYREACEKRVVELNKVNEQAYFYHGPHRSMVTVGLFTRDDAFVKIKKMNTDGSTFDQEQYSPQTKQYQERYPHNIYNEQDQKTDKDGNPTHLISSGLVKLP